MQRKGRLSASTGKGGTGKASPRGGGPADAGTVPNIRNYTKLSLAQVKEDAGDLRSGRARSGLEGSSAIQTEREGGESRFEEGRSAA